MNSRSKAHDSSNSPRPFRRPLNIVLLDDSNAIHGSDPECLKPYGRFDSDTYQVAGAIRNLGHKLTVTSFDPSLANFFKKIQALRPHIIFNFTEAVDGDRRAAANIAAILELLNIPYTGSGAKALVLTLDKALTKQVLAWHKVPVPDFFVVHRDRPLNSRGLRFPLFVKPLHGGGKEGISLAAIVHNQRTLQHRIDYTHQRWSQPAICERYIEGRELTLAIMGNRTLTMFPPRELVLTSGKSKAPRVLTQRVLEDKNYRRRWNVQMVDAQLTAEQRRRLFHLGRTAYRALGLQGYARFDIRLGTDGQFYFIEANANPALRRTSKSLIAPWGNIPYEDLIDRIIRLGLQRFRNRTRDGSLL